MIGQLPTSLEVNGISYDIDTDYRIALNIFEAYNDPDITPQEAAEITLNCLCADVKQIPDEDIGEALKRAVWFLDGGDMVKRNVSVKVIDWQQDEQMIFSAVNSSARCELRALPYLHWWTFLSYFTAIDGESLLSTVMHIRAKKGKGKALDKVEKEFYAENKELIDIRQRYSEEEQEVINRLNL